MSKLAYIQLPLDESGLDRDEVNRRTNKILQEKRQKFPHATKGKSYERGVRQRVIQLMREGK